MEKGYSENNLVLISICMLPFYAEVWAWMWIYSLGTLLR
jgi:hypothetical protein